MPVWIAVVGLFNLCVKWDRIVVVQMAIDLVHLIAYGFQRTWIALQSQDRLQQLRIKLAALEHAAKAKASATLERRLCIFVMELVLGLVPRASEDVAPSMVGLIRAPFFDIASHIVCAVRSEAASAANLRGSFPPEIAETQNLRKHTRCAGRVEPVKYGGQLFARV